MILLDVNVLIAAHRSDHPHHDLVRPWFDGMIRDGSAFTVPDIVGVGFVRIVTNRRAIATPSPSADALSFLLALIRQAGCVSLAPGPHHHELFRRTCLESDATGDLVTDAYLAALAIEHGGTVVSLDRDFARFEGLRWERPG